MKEHITALLVEGLSITIQKKDVTVCDLSKYKTGNVIERNKYQVHSPKESRLYTSAAEAADNFMRLAGLK